MFMGRDSSITAKLTRMNMLVSATALLLACAAFAGYELVAFRQGIVRALSIQAQIVGSNSVSALLFNDPRSAGSTLAALSAAPAVVGARIFTTDSKPFAEYQRGAEAPSAMPSEIRSGHIESHRFTAGNLVLARRIIFQGKTVGFVLISSDLREFDQLLARYAVVIILVVAACLAAVLVISSFLQRGVAQPIISLAEAAQTISREKNYSIRIPSAGRRDELGILMDSFNEMLAQVQERDSALQRAHNELEARVEERTAQLEAANKELEAFSYSVSHDLRAPLRQINGFAKVLADDFGQRLDAPAQRYLTLIQDGARKMGQLTDDLINMGRIGRLELAMKPANLSAILRDVLHDLEPEVQARLIDWRIGALPVLLCDPGLIRLALMNLLGNAVKYTRQRERAVIEAGMMALNGETVFFVRDNGAGFDPKYSHKLFGVFERLHRSDEFEGTGVGLATVKRIIEKHGGRIWAEGEVGRGATFYFTLKSASVSGGRESFGNVEVSRATRND